MLLYDPADRAERLEAGKEHSDSAGAQSLRALVRNGRVTDPRDSSCPLDSRRLTSTPDLPAGAENAALPLYIFAVDEQMEIRIAPDGVRGQPGALKHESLFGGRSVLAAGEIAFEDGVVVDLNDRSGTYRSWGALRTMPSFAHAFVRSLDAIGATMSDEIRRRLESLSKTRP